MSAKPLLALLAAASALAPVAAQTSGTDASGRSTTEEYQRGYAATPMPNQAAINAGGQAGTAALNNGVQASAAASNAAVLDNADAQAQYQADRQAYMDALMRHDAAVDRTDSRYVRQQNAYADAMRAWRRQVYACHHGHPRACKMPAPNPADFY